MAESSPKWVENTVGKGENARYEQISPFPTVFSKNLYCTRKNQGLFGKGLINKPCEKLPGH